MSKSPVAVTESHHDLALYNAVNDRRSDVEDARVALNTAIIAYERAILGYQEAARSFDESVGAEGAPSAKRPQPSAEISVLVEREQKARDEFLATLPVVRSGNRIYMGSFPHS